MRLFFLLFYYHSTLLDKNRGSQKIVSREVQAALSVIKRRDISKDPKQKTLDLSFSYLRGANLRGESFRSFITRKESFEKSSLERVNFTGSNLESSDFTGSNLRDACFVKSNLNGAKLARANLLRVDFTDASVVGTDFTDASLQKIRGLNTAKK